MAHHAEEFAVNVQIVEHARNARRGAGTSSRYLDSLTKRAFDVVVATVALVLCFPLFVVIALLVRLSGPSVFFLHERLGRDGNPFLCIKFRTMVPDADQLLHEVLTDRATRDLWHRERKLPNDPRVTAIGRFLRRTSLDELPQLWNVLRGEMSMVGARPIALDEQAIYGAHVRSYIRFRPGITGLWQVSGRSNISFSQRSDFDMRYFESASLKRDLSILVLTIPAAALSRGAV